MELNNKFNIGETVFYPGADLGNGLIFKSTITGIKVTQDSPEVAEHDGALRLIYSTEHSYGVKETDLFTEPDNAKDRLLEIYGENKEKICKQIDDAVTTVKGKSIDDLIYEAPVANAQGDEREN